jgi:cytochrome c-type biogenesis protein
VVVPAPFARLGASLQGGPPCSGCTAALLTSNAACPTRHRAVRASADPELRQLHHGPQPRRRAAVASDRVRALFAAGFTSVLLVLGATATVIGQLLLRNREWVGRSRWRPRDHPRLVLAGSVQPSVVGTGRSRACREQAVRLPRYFSRRNGIRGRWTPCIGLILGGILTYNASSADLNRGLWLLLSYSPGLAVPRGADVRQVHEPVEALQRARWPGCSGLLLKAFGLLMITDNMTVLTAWLQRWTPEFLRNRI